MKYGTTPWGAWFVGALEGYDESGRLARGKSYANTGKVKDLIVKDGTATAKVAGRSRPWYKVTVRFKPLSPADRERLLNIIRSDPLLLPRIEAGELPGELADKLRTAKIDLMPKRWNDMERRCSCPDWGDPCKHMAAVYYLLAKEIDQDPRILFELRGVKLGGARRVLPIGKKAAAATGGYGERIAEPFTWHLTDNPTEESRPLPDGEEYPFFEGGENYTGLVSALLPKENSFTEGDFAAELVALYHRTDRAESRALYGTSSDADESLERHFSGARYHVVPAEGPWTESAPTAPPRIAAVFASGEKLFFDIKEAADLFLGFSGGSGTTEYTYLFNLFRLFTALRKSGAFAPAPRLSGSSLSVLWRPLRYLREVKDLLARYAELLPPGLLSGLPGRVPSRESVVEYLAVSCLTAWIHGSMEKIKASRADRREAFGLFFHGTRVDVSKLGKRAMPRALAAFLAPLALDFTRCFFRFTLGYAEAEEDKAEEPAAEFTLALDYLPRQESGSVKPVPLMNAADSPGGTEALRNAAVLSAYLPEIRDLASIKRTTLKEGRIGNFLCEAGPVLRRMGAEVVLPKALRRALKPRAAVKVEVEGTKTLTSYLGLDEILNYDRGIAIGDRFLSGKEFERLVKEKREIVVFRDGFVRLDPEEAARLLEEAGSRLPLGPLDLLRARLSGDAVFSADAEKIASSLFREREIPIPDSLLASLRPYQKRGYRWAYSNLMSGFGCVLADDMGLGKTVQAIAVMLRLREEGLAGDGILVAAPAALLENWERELARFAPSLSAMRYHGTKRAFRDGIDVLITTYATATRDMKALSERNFSLLVADEAHLLKNAATRQSKALKDIRARYKLALSGTPVENKLEDLRSLFDLVLPGYLGNPAEFKQFYRVPIEVDRDKTAAEKLKRVTSLKQVCDHPRVYDKESPAEMGLSGKALLLIELLRQMLDRREKVLIFSQYVECLEVLRTILRDELGEECLLYSGRLGQKARAEAVKSFQTDPGRRIMLISLKAGGLGLNLTAASRVVHYDLWFNPAVENQATDRAFRIGQRKNVFVHRLIAAGTFEERIDAMLKSKRELADMSVASGESWISRMGNEELKELFG
jgi:uncharacterized Zn finger protein/superfamily II DNA or RNA helicase